MTRGEISTVSGTGYAGKPRPAVIVQDDGFDATESITVCVFTTDETEALEAGLVGSGRQEYPVRALAAGAAFYPFDMTLSG